MKVAPNVLIPLPPLEVITMHTEIIIHQNTVEETVLMLPLHFTKHTMKEEEKQRGEHFQHHVTPALWIKNNNINNT